MCSWAFLGSKTEDLSTTDADFSSIGSIGCNYVFTVCDPIFMVFYLSNRLVVILVISILGSLAWLIINYLLSCSSGFGSSYFFSIGGSFISSFEWLLFLLWFNAWSICISIIFSLCFWGFGIKFLITVFYDCIECLVFPNVDDVCFYSSFDFVNLLLSVDAWVLNLLGCYDDLALIPRMLIVGDLAETMTSEPVSVLSSSESSAILVDSLDFLVLAADF